MEPPIDIPHDGRIRLPQGSTLRDLYVIETELGAGGFGITYRGRHAKIGRLFAIKEYFPVDFSVRDDTRTIRPTSMTQRAIFEWGIKSFLKEATLLATFNHPSIVGVQDHFEENGTAYMVLDYVPGVALRHWPAQLGRQPAQDEMDRIVKGLCEALRIVHERNLVHRDIAPDNVIVRPEGNPVLLDFGAARTDFAAETRATRQFSSATSSYAVVKPYYSPIEQHSDDKTTRGPWSDIYSLGATLYFIVTGQRPVDVLKRVTATVDPLVPAVTASRGAYRAEFLAAIDAALRMKHDERPLTIAEFERLAFAEPRRPAPTPIPLKPVPPKPAPPRPVAEDQIVRPAPPQRPEPAPAPVPSALPPRTQRSPVAAILATGLILTGAAAAVLYWQPWKTPIEQTARTWIALRDTAAVEVRAASEMLTKASASVSRSDWSSAKREVSEADGRIKTARKSVDRLQATASEVEKRLIATQYSDQLDQMGLIMSTLRRSIELGERQQAPNPPPPIVTPPPPAVTPPPVAPRQPTVSYWRHNGSIMRLVSDGTQRRQMFYEAPTDLIRGAGARPGTLLFEGERRGDTYVGTSRLFSSVCGENPYQVTGTVSTDQRRVELRGQARRLDRRTCQPAEPFEDVLVFELIENYVPGTAVRGFELQIRPGNFAAQVGAHKIADDAHGRIAEVRALFPETLRDVRARVSEEDQAEGFRFKARFVGIDEATARSLCAEIVKVQGPDKCFPVKGGW